MECMGFEGCMDVAMDLMERFAKGLYTRYLLNCKVIDYLCMGLAISF